MDRLPLKDYRPSSALRVPAREVERARFPAIDAHAHLGRWLTGGEWAAPDVGALLATMDACNVTAVVNLDGIVGKELEANVARYDRMHPDRFVTFCQLDWRVTAEPGFGAALARQLREAREHHQAHGLKVWKDLGLHIRDDLGELLMPDDDRLADLWAAAADLRLPVMLHTADPIAFFDPVDPTNERLEELLANPDWSFADRERFPPYERLRDAFEGVVAAQPGTMFIGAHVASAAEDLVWVARMLETYPNLVVDIAARIGELGRQPRAARELIVAHPDRVLLGTDDAPPDPAGYGIHFRFLETEDEHFAYSVDDPPPQGRWAISGLGLPDDILRRVYADNAIWAIPELPH